MDDQMILADGGLFGISMPWEDWGKSFQALMSQSIESFANVTWQMLKGAFTAGTFTDGGSAQDWWIAIVGGTVNVTTDGQFQYSIEYPGMLNIMVIAMIPLFFIFVTLQIVLSVFRSSTAGMLRAFGTAILGIPAVYVLGGLVFLGLRGSDAAAQWIIEAAAGGSDGKEEVGLNGIYQLFGMAWDPSANGGKGGVLLDANYQAWALAGNQDAPGQVILPWIVAALILCVSLVLMLMMLFRTIAVLVVTMFAPVAVFSLSFEAAKNVFSKWIGVIVALLIAKPIAAGIVMFGVTMSSIGSDWVQIVAGGALVLIAAAMPVMCLALVGFMTPEGGHALERAGADAGQRAKRTAGASVRNVSRGAGNLVRSGSRSVSNGFSNAKRQFSASLGPSSRGNRGANGGSGAGSSRNRAAPGRPKSTTASGPKPSRASGSSGGGSSGGGGRDVPGVTKKPGSSIANKNRN